MRGYVRGAGVIRGKGRRQNRRSIVSSSDWRSPRGPTYIRRRAATAIEGRVICRYSLTLLLLRVKYGIESVTGW